MSRFVAPTEDAPPAPPTDDELADVIEPRDVGLAFKLAGGAAYFGNAA